MAHEREKHELKEIRTQVIEDGTLLGHLLPTYTVHSRLSTEQFVKATITAVNARVSLQSAEHLPVV